MLNEVLFDASAYKNPAKRPGQMNLDEWVETQNPVFHGTFRSDFDNAPVAHYGTLGQAVSRLDTVSQYMKNNTSMRRSYYDPSSHGSDYEYDEEPEDVMHVGQIHARRLTDAVPGPKKLLSDPDANGAEMGFRYKHSEEDFEIPRSVVQSAGHSAPKLTTDGRDNPVVIHRSTKAAYGQRQLERGNVIQYDNVAEKNDDIDSKIPKDKRTIAYAAPRGAATSWEEDVLDEPTAAPAAQRFAQQRIDQGKEGAVPFPSPNWQDMTGGDRQLQIPMPFDDREKRSGNTGDTQGRWAKYGVKTLPTTFQNRTLTSIQFTTKDEY